MRGTSVNACVFRASDTRNRKISKLKKKPLLNLINVFLRVLWIEISACWLIGCTHLSPLRENTNAHPQKSVIANADYKLAFIEFGEQGSYQDTSQLKNATELVQNTDHPLVITYVHGWQNNAESD